MARRVGCFWLLLALACQALYGQDIETRLGDGDLELGPFCGVRWRADDGPVRLHAGGLFALDYRLFDGRNEEHPQLWLDRALLRLEAQLHAGLSFFAEADLKGIDSRYGFEQLWLRYAPLQRALRLHAGLLHLRLGLEHSLPEESLPFVDYAFPAFISARSDVGLLVDGELAEGLFSYALGLGSGLGFDPTGQRRKGAQLLVRIQSYPLRFVEAAVEPIAGYRFPLFSGLFFSGGASLAADFEGHFDVPTSLRNKLFFTPSLDGGTSRFWLLGYGLDLGPLRVLHEFGRGGVDSLQLPGGGREDFDNQISSWALSVHLRLTGEPYDSRLTRQDPGVARDVPRHPLFGGDEGAQGIGALELAFRYANADIDRKFFTHGFTAPDQSSQEFRSAEGALSWIPVAGLRFTVQLSRIIADQFPAAFASHGRDTSVAFRLQWSF